MFYIIIYFIKFILFFIPLLVAIAFLTLLERKIIASMQQRRGPNVVGFLGLLQPLADGFKLVLKETLLPSFASTLLFLIAPIITFACALLLWFVIPYNNPWNNLLSLDFNILYILIISSLSVYGIIFAGWASNSKYAFLGALRSAAQMISYEVSLGLIILNLVVFTDSLNLSDIIEAQQEIWYIIPLFPGFILFFISALAETNRTPFDLPEAEGELVAGYNVEYSGLTFALFFLAEYSNIIFMSTLCTILFLGGNSLSGLESFINICLNINFIISKMFYSFLMMEYSLYNYTQISDFNVYLSKLSDLANIYYKTNEITYINKNNAIFISTIFFIIKILIFLFLFIWVRATYPRYRYDQLMTLGWKVFLPVTLGYLLLNYIISFIFNL